MSASGLLPPDAARAMALPERAEPDPGTVVSRTLLQTPELRVVHFTFAPGQELTTHRSRRRALVQILEGRCAFLFDDRWHELGAGALVHLPPDHPHALRAESGSFSMLLVLASEPGPESVPSNLPA